LALLRFSDLFLTAASRALLGESFAFAPPPSARLEAWVARALRASSAVAQPSAELKSAVGAPPEGAARDLGVPALEAARNLAELGLRRVQEEAGVPWVAQGRLDPAMPLPFVVG
jgi:hypothetical protein